MKVSILCMLILMTFLQIGSTQKTLLIERRGSPVTQRIQLYEELTFQLKNDDAGWYTRTIYDLDPNAQLIFFGESWISIDEKVKVLVCLDKNF